MHRHRSLAALLLVLPLAMGVDDEACAGAGSDTQEPPPPVLTITSPADGTFSDAPTILVTGYARRGWGTIASLEVNGVDVLPLTPDPNDGTWSVVLPLDSNAIFNEIYAEMTLSGGTKYRRRISVIAGDGVNTSSVADGSFSPQSIAMRLNDSGLDQIEPAVTQLLNLDPAVLLPVGTQVINEFCYADLFGLCIGSADAFIASNPSPASPSISSFGVDMDAQTNQVNGVISLNDLFVRARVEDGDDGIGFTCHVNISAALSTIDGNYALEPNAVDLTTIDVTQLGGVVVNFGSFSDSTDCDGFLGFLVEAFVSLFVDSFEDLMRTAFADFLNQVDGMGNTALAAGIEAALVDIQITGPIGEALGATLDTTLFMVSEDTDGITLGNDGQFIATPVASGLCYDEVTWVQIPGPVVCSAASPCMTGEVCFSQAGECVAPASAPDFAASYHVFEPFPVLGATTPGALPYGLGLCISTSAFNQLLKAQLECGLLNQEVTDVPGLGVLTGTALSLLIPEIAMYPLSTEYKLILDPTTSAIITGNPGPLGELAELRIHGLNVYLEDVAGALPRLLTLSIDARIGLDASFSAGALSFQLGTPDPVNDIDVTLMLNRLGTDPNAIEDLVAGVFALAAPGLGDALAAFPLPNFLGLELTDVEVGLAGEFLSLYLDLQPSP